MSNDFQRVSQGSDRDFRGRSSLLRLLHIDLWLLLPLLALCAAGLVVLFSASGESDAMLSAQIRNLLIAGAVLLVSAQFRVEFYRGVAPYIFFATVALLVAVAFYGVGAKGAQRWLSLGVVRFQPSEIMKVAMPLALAWWLAKRPLPPSAKHLAIAFMMVLVPGLLILRQPDLGTSLLVMASGLAVIYMAGLPWRFILAGVVAGIAAIVPLWPFVLKD